MSSFHRLRGLLLVLALLASTPAWADVVINSSLDLTQLLVNPSSGSLVVLSPVMASVLAQALDSTGGLDQNSNSVNDAPVPVSAATPFANASGTVSAPALMESVLANVSLSNQFNGFASSEGQALLFGMFEITEATGPVLKTLKASINGNQFQMTSGTGVSLSSETIFTLTLPDINSLPLLSSPSPLSVGPNQTLTIPANMALPPISASLLPDTRSFFAAPDAESSRVREPASFALLLTAYRTFSPSGPSRMARAAAPRYQAAPVRER